MANAGRQTVRQRPISPHLQVYRLIPTMVMSIVHRITGAGLYFGTVLVAWWFLAAASGEAAFDQVSAVYGSFLGRLVLIGFTWALIHHMLGGIRYLVWDTGRAMEPQTSTRIVLASLVASVTLTVMIWIVGYLT